jgi:hypothetical protein
VLNLELQIREQRKAFSELQETIGNNIMVTQLQSIIIAQSKEINELKVNCLEAQISDRMSSSNCSTQTHLNTFNFTKYAEHKSNNDLVFSPPFYSSPEGYKLCIKVYANGVGNL